MSDVLWGLLEREDIDGKYYLETLLGSGSYGGVFLADEVVGDHFIRRVAVKLITLGLDQQNRNLQLQELIAAVNLDHSNLVRCFVSGQCTIKGRDFLYLVMEVAQGTLQEHIDKTKTLPVAEVEEIVKAIASGLVYLHGQRNPRVHRDLKPGNILQVDNRDVKPGNILQVDSCWKISDFGLLRSMNSQKSERTNSHKGTAKYSPPESYEGVVATSFDIWSLGVMIVEMLTGQLPFTAESEQHLMAQVIQELPSIDWSKIPEPLAKIVNGCLEKDRNKRPTAAQVLDALTRKIPTLTPPPPTPTPTPTPTPPLPPPTPPPSLTPVPLPRIPRASPRIPPASLTPPPSPPTPTPTPTPPPPTPTPTPTPPTRRGFLQFVGYAGVGLVGAVVTKSLLNNSSNSLTTVQFETVTVNSKGEITKRSQSQAQVFTETIAKGITLEMMAIPGGSFVMGSPNTEAGRRDTEGPQHTVNVAAFFMGKYEVTQAQWRAVAGLPKVKIDLNANPSGFKGDDLPVEIVTWDEAIEFCARLSRLTGRKYRLPSEAEWEYACRAGTTTPFYFGDTITPDLVNYNGNGSYASAPKGIYREKTTVVGSFPPNSFGLYDMHGNVDEWCQDIWHDNYNGAPTDGSAWETGEYSTNRMLRGGSWYYNAVHCRAAYRGDASPVGHTDLFGFRVVCAAT